MKPIVFYDLEVFRFDNLAVFYEMAEDGSPVFRHALWNDDPNRREIIGSYIDSHILCGYNNHHYDDHILVLMRQGAEPNAIKARNDAIIYGGNENIIAPKTIESIDCIQQISVSHPSLKQIEGNIGMSVEESSVPFTIDRPLTADERAETEKYCRHDVEATIEVYKLRKKAYFDIRDTLIGMLPEGDRDYASKTNTTTIAARILLGNDENSMRNKISYLLPYRMQRTGDLGSKIPSNVWDMWMEPVNHPHFVNDGALSIPTGQNQKVMLGDCEYIFGFGGLHGAPKRPGKYYDIKLADVGSMYPSIIVATEALGEATAKYDDIRKERLRIKHTDKVRANALKLILNSVYGNLKNQYNPLYAPSVAASVCIYGQIALYNLCLALENAGYRVINANTDGVAFYAPKGLIRPTRTYEDIRAEWESNFTGLVLELDEFEHWWQRDVNNYIAIQGDHVKTKGGDVNKYEADKPFDNNSLRIVQRALVECIVNKGGMNEVTIQKIVRENLHDHPEWYQVVLKAGSTYDGTIDEDGNAYQNVNRVYAARRGVRLYKKRPDGGRVLFPDAPTKMLVVNGDLKPGCLTWDELDKDYYVNLIKKKMEGWKI